EAGIEEADAVVVATDGDNTNIVIGQVEQQRFDNQCVVVRVLDSARAEFYRQRGLRTVCPTSVAIDALLDAVRGCEVRPAEVPEHDLVHLLELRKENLEIVEVMIDEGAPAAGQRVEALHLPEGSRLISIMRSGRSEIAVGSTELLPGDQVLAILQPGKEDELRKVLLKT